MYNGIEIIAEVKTQSPYGFKSKYNWDYIFFIADKIGDIISIHTDPRWGGNFDLIKKARGMTEMPILAKGIHSIDDEIKRAIDCGANYILAVGRIPSVYMERCFIEPLDLAQLAVIPRDFKVVWNSRDLKTGKPKKESFEEARRIWDGWLCQASYIKSITDVNNRADAVLVGENLVEFANSFEIGFK